jgi:NAD(P)-dependent dehydrogenase (short-subunit alcohol dehydrogenase family)
VADEEQCIAMVEQAESSLGGLDGLVLNVGIGLGAGLEGTSAEAWDQAMAVNLRAHFLICKAALPWMGEGAAIVLMSSVAGLRAGSRSPSYDSSKAALFGLCRHVAREGVSRGVRANTVTPGLIDTPLGRAAKARNPSRAGGASRVPMRREGTAWEIAYATVFLLSGEASYITGQTLIVDGGLTT